MVWADLWVTFSLRFLPRKFLGPRDQSTLANISYSDYIAHLDGYTVIAGGWLNHNWIQLGYQLADSVTGAAYSFAGTCLILACLDLLGKFLPVFKLRVSEEEEVLGIDDVEIGEFAVSSVSNRFVSLTNKFSMTTLSSHEMSSSQKMLMKACQLTLLSRTPPLWEPTRKPIQWIPPTNLPNGLTVHRETTAVCLIFSARFIPTFTLLGVFLTAILPTRVYTVACIFFLLIKSIYSSHNTWKGQGIIF